MSTSIDSTQINELAVSIADRIFIQVGKWNLYLGDAGLARDLAIECISNIERGSHDAAKLSLESIKVKIGDGNHTILLSKLITSSQLCDLEEILDNL